MNRLAIIEDNLDFSRNLLNYIMNENKKIQLWSLAVDGNEIWDHLEEFKEDDIVLLDLCLETINGIEVIQRLTQRNGKIPYIIVMSGKPELIKELRNYEKYIYTVLEKPFPFDKIVEIIEQITKSSKQVNFERMAINELDKFEVNAITIGYKYILESIVLALEDEMLLKDMKNLLYKRISINHNYINPINIKWAIEKSIQSIRRYTPYETMNTYFRLGKKEKLTPKMFIVTIVHNLKKKCEEEQEEKENKLIIK